mmetsp:Transcript_49607/g.105410  ORF Transcript_49607/g.105410 Transcript_49607/m.105410 type:complete len:216 (+) Transcript_49607:465-1112(+)
MEPWEVTFAVGKVAQGFAEEWLAREGLNPREDEGDLELVQVMSGRVMAVLTRLEELEEDLLDRCCNPSKKAETILNDFSSLGVPEEEMNAWRAGEEDTTKRVSDAAAAIDAACLFDEPLRYNRARSLLGMFLHEIEVPGLRQNGALVPYMEVDFLSKDERGVLFKSKDEVEEPAPRGCSRCFCSTSRRPGWRLAAIRFRGGGAPQISSRMRSSWS